MSQHSRGIILTRSIQLPFPPSGDIAIFGRDLMEDGSEPMGIMLKDIIWDTDRQVFFAKTYLDDGSCPLTMVPQELRRHHEKGWRFGSYVDLYGNPEYKDPPPSEPSSPIPNPSRRDLRENNDSDEMLKWKPERRSRYFNAVFGAFIRCLAESFEISTAVAMERTGVYFDEHEVKGTPWKRPPDEVLHWDEIREQFFKTSSRGQMSWRKKLIGKYHSLQALTNAL